MEMIRISNLGKCYQVDHATGIGKGYRTLREDLVRLAKLPLRMLRGNMNGYTEDFWALRNVDFTVKQGEVVGIIGRNGAGKSTLLKILSRITAPTTGQAELFGRVGSLLEVGTGFHPELTGRENIYLNGAILGMRKAEITRNFDAIVDFAEVEQFLDTPVKRYSSGMYVRLAFAVAAHLEPEILIVDEVLAVGDVTFQKKCLGKMNALSEGGRTVLFVSHNMPAVRSMTHRCVYLQSGQVVTEGPTAQVIDRYLADAWNVDSGDSVNLEYYRRDKNRQSPVTITGLWVEGGAGGQPPIIRSGENFTIHVRFSADRAFEGGACSFWLTNQQGERVATFFGPDSGFCMPIRPGTQEISCEIRRMPLSPGRYNLTLGLNETTTTVAWDVMVDFPALRVVLPEMDNGALDWSFRPWGCLHWPDVSWDNVEFVPHSY